MEANTTFEVIRFTIEALLGGGLLLFFTLREKKEAAKLENDNRIIKNSEETNAQWKSLLEMVKAELVQTKEEKEELEAKVEQKNDKIESLSKQLDLVNTQLAVAKITRCEKMDCTLRIPPLTESYAEQKKVMERDEQEYLKEENDRDNFEKNRHRINR